MQLTLTDFKNHARKISTLSGVTEIRGKNGAGKTAILEALVFALFGRDFYGNVAFDHYVKKGTLATTVTLETPGFMIRRSGGGPEHSVYVNGIKTRLSEAGSMLPPLEIALPLINPLYFLYEMGDLDRRKFFMRIVPQADRMEVFRKKFSSDEVIVERFKLTDLDSLKRQKRMLEATIIANDLAVQGYEAQILSLGEKIRQLESETKVMPKGVLESEKDKQREINEIQARLDVIGNVPEREKEAQLALKNLADRIRPSLERYGKTNITDLLAYIRGITASKLKEAEGLHANVTEASVKVSQYEQFASGKCPVCGSSVAEAALELQEAKERLESYRNNYQTVKTQLVALDGALKVAEKISEEVALRRAEIKSCKLKIKEYERLHKKLALLKSQLVGLSEDDFKKAVEVEAKRENLKRLKQELKEAKREIGQVRESSVAIKKELENVKLLIEAGSPQGVEAELAMNTAEILQGEMSKLLKQKVEIFTVRKNKSNDNIKEVFDVSVEGVNVRSMSFGERIKISVAFGLVARKYANAQNIGFVLLDEASVLSKDNLESITSMITSAGLDFYYTIATADKELVINKLS